MIVVGVIAEQIVAHHQGEGRQFSNFNTVREGEFGTAAQSQRSINERTCVVSFCQASGAGVHRAAICANKTVVIEGEIIVHRVGQIHLVQSCARGVLH